MPTASVALNTSIGGVSFSARITRTAAGQISHVVTLPAGQAGELTTRTDNDTGVVTTTATPTVEADDLVVVSWSGGRRYGAVVDSVDGNAITFGTTTVGAGDNLPIAETAVVISKMVEIDTDFDGDLMELLHVHCNKSAVVQFREEDDTSIYAMDVTASESLPWVSDLSGANPLTGDPVGNIIAGTTDTEAAELRVGVLYESA